MLIVQVGFDEGCSKVAKANAARGTMTKIGPTRGGDACVDDEHGHRYAAPVFNKIHAAAA